MANDLANDPLPNWIIVETEPAGWLASWLAFAKYLQQRRLPTNSWNLYSLQYANLPVPKGQQVISIGIARNAGIQPVVNCN